MPANLHGKGKGTKKSGAGGKAVSVMEAGTPAFFAMKSSKSKSPPKTRLSRRRRILVVDDHPMVVQGLTRMFEEGAFKATAASSGPEALKLLQARRFDLLTTDITMGGMNGLELIEKVVPMYPDMPIVVITMHDPVFLRKEATHPNVKAIIQKDEAPEKLLGIVGEILSATGTSRSRVAVPESGLVISPEPQVKDLFPFVVGGLLHDARNTLFALNEKVRRLEAGPAKGQAGSVQSIANLVHALDQAFGTIHEIARAYYSDQNHLTKSVEGMTDSIVQDFRNEWPAIQLNVSVDAQFHQTKLPVGVSLFVVRELLHNAAKACGQGEQPQIKFSIKVADDQTVRFRCENSHGSFPADKLDQIRQQAIRPGPNAANSGRGLYFISEVAKRLVGLIKAENLKPTGAIVEAWLPTRIQKP